MPTPVIRLLTLGVVCLVPCCFAAVAADPPPPTDQKPPANSARGTEDALQQFESTRFGLKLALPKQWPIVVSEEDDRVFVAMVPQENPDRPGVVACELGLASERLEDYRSRIQTSADRGGGGAVPKGASLIQNEILQAKSGDRLETVYEFHPPGGKVWRERKVRVFAHRQMYLYTLNVEASRWAKAAESLDRMLDAAVYSPPETGIELKDRASNRWLHSELRFGMELPKDWSPVLAPSEIAVFFANGPAHGIWSDNVLILAKPRQSKNGQLASLDLENLAQTFPARLKAEDPSCEVLSCRVIEQRVGSAGTPATSGEKALETVVKTTRGPFSMTVLERRFVGRRFLYEVKFTLESKRFDTMTGELRRCLDTFEEDVAGGPAPGGKPRTSGL